MADLTKLQLPGMGQTWDGLFKSEDPPYGANIVILRRVDRALEYLVLHRAHLGRDTGDWAWGPPAGSRMPGETIEGCAVRELDEETGLDVALTPLDFEQDDGWVSYWAEVRGDADIALSYEHDAYEWVDLDEATRRCQPAIVSAQFAAVARVADTAAA